MSAILIKLDHSRSPSIRIACWDNDIGNLPEAFNTLPEVADEAARCRTDRHYRQNRHSCD